ncbi:hypothetical protein GC176_02320 [bacterium]|nr:hypothetical protein [bacterium]
MSPVSEKLIEEFQRLPEADQRELLLELLKRGPELDGPSIEDDEAIAIAAVTLSRLDKEEARDAQGV